MLKLLKTPKLNEYENYITQYCENHSLATELENQSEKKTLLSFLERVYIEPIFPY